MSASDPRSLTLCPTEEAIWTKSDEVNQKDQREYTIVIGRPGVFKLFIKRLEKLSLGIKRPVCVVKLIRGQDAKTGTVLATQYVIHMTLIDIFHHLVIIPLPLLSFFFFIWTLYSTHSTLVSLRVIVDISMFAHTSFFFLSNRIGSAAEGDIIHVFPITEVPCTIYLRLWAVVPGTVICSAFWKQLDLHLSAVQTESRFH